MPNNVTDKNVGKMKALEEKVKKLEDDYKRLQAYKEFAERLEDRIADRLDQSLDNPDGNNYFITDVFTDIKNILKELVGENK
jgi:hypothetical protein